MRTAPNKVDLVGQRFNRLLVIAETGRTPAKQTLWLCRCECGETTSTTTTKLRSGHSKSCGCLKAEAMSIMARRDGMHVGGRHRMFDSYAGMVARCTNENDEFFANYGGRGITICERWRHGEGGKTGFHLFVKDMGPRPSARHSIDRKNNDGNYEPDNCRWATKKQQARNRRSNHLVECDGEPVALSEYCERKGLRFVLINQRIGRGWSLERAVSQKPRGEAVLSCR
jgi:hypothetical protein